MHRPVLFKYSWFWISPGSDVAQSTVSKSGPEDSFPVPHSLQLTCPRPSIIIIELYCCTHLCLLQATNVWSFYRLKMQNKIFKVNNQSNYTPCLHDPLTWSKCVDWLDVDKSNGCVQKHWPSSEVATFRNALLQFPFILMGDGYWMDKCSAMFVVLAYVYLDTK